jgi:hypothetical protein
MMIRLPYLKRDMDFCRAVSENVDVGVGLACSFLYEIPFSDALRSR